MKFLTEKQWQAISGLPEKVDRLEKLLDQMLVTMEMKKKPCETEECKDGKWEDGGDCPDCEGNGFKLRY